MKKKIFKTILILFLITALGVSVFFGYKYRADIKDAWNNHFNQSSGNIGADYTYINQQLSIKEEQLTQMSQELNTTKQELNKANNSLQTLNTKLEELQVDITANAEAIAEIQLQIQSVNENITALNNSIDEITTAIESIRADITAIYTQITNITSNNNFTVTTPNYNSTYIKLFDKLRVFRYGKLVLLDFSGIDFQNLTNPNVAYTLITDLPKPTGECHGVFVSSTNGEALRFAILPSGNMINYYNVGYHTGEKFCTNYVYLTNDEV